MADELKPCPMCGQPATLVAMEDYHMAMCECGVNYEGPTVEDCVDAWNRRAAPSSPVGDDGLPPLPEPVRFAQWTGGVEFAYTAEQVRQAQREAVEADRRACAQQPAQGESVDTPEFRELLDEFAYRAWERRALGGDLGSAEAEGVAEAHLITHIDTWATRRAAGSTTKENG